MNSDNRELHLAHEMADAAGDILRKYYRAPIAIEHKADDSPVTKADRECESAIRRLIEENFPDHGIIGEEHGSVRNHSPYQWVLDPIDGTRAFISGYPTFTTLIALVKNGNPILGIIDQPISRERWVGAEGIVSTCNGNALLPQSTASLKLSDISTTSTDYFTSEEAQIFEHIKRQCKNVTLGGDAYAYAMLTSGELDIVIDAGMKPYDFCALKPVVEGAGAIITDWEGEPLTLTSMGRVLAAANKTLHTEALKITQQL